MYAPVLVLDVRTPMEFTMGHHPGSLNIPLAELQHRCADLDPATPVVVCCASGARSGIAKAILESRGFAQVTNAGPWTCVRPLPEAR